MSELACTCDTDFCLLHKVQIGLGYWPIKKISLSEFKEQYPSNPATNTPTITPVSINHYGRNVHYSGKAKQ